MRQRNKAKIIGAKIGANFSEKLKELYAQNMSSHEISEWIKQNTGIDYSARSIQRILHKLGVMRSAGDSFRLAIKRGRVQWAYKSFRFKRHKLNPKLRYAILHRDKFRCVKCGNTAKNALLEVDHINPICKGGLSIPENLETLCHHCNKGKQFFKKEN